jgi:membrane protease YdiL (CAAX protease family)
MKEVILVIILTFCIFPITSFTGELNSGLHLPEWFSEVEKWMIEKEDKAAGLIDLLISSDNFWSMMLNLLVLAVIPAIGEELIFRGVFQKIGYKLFKSVNVSIWITAFIFSTIHFQFFGFIPRFILGLVFGYLFLWSGTLWLPVISHFVNNAVPVIGAYIQGWERFNTYTGLSKQLPGLLLSIIITLGIMLYFKKNSNREIEIV